MLSNWNKQHRKKQYSTCPDLINTKKSILTLWYTKIKNLHKMRKLETEKKTYVLSSEILEKETPKNEKLGKVVTQKN